MALILAEPGIPGKMEIFGVVSIIADPDNERAEYAIVVRHDMTGLGLGILLMRRIIDYASERGIGEIYVDHIVSLSPEEGLIWSDGGDTGMNPFTLDAARRALL